MEFNYREEIKLNLLKRKSNNSSYSLRAYSRDLGVSLTALSSLISGKRNLSLKNALKVAQGLSFSPLQTKLMIQSINSVSSIQFIEGSELVKEDEFNLIANWYCIALLTLIRNKKTKNKPKELSNKFGVDSSKIKESILVLKRLGYIEIIDGFLIRKINSIKTTNNIPSEALKKYHKSNLELAQKSLFCADVNERHITNLSLSVAKKDLAKANKLINKFKKEFDEKMDNKKSDKVYNFSIQFFEAKNHNIGEFN